MPHVTAKQASALLEMTSALQNQVQPLNRVRTQVTIAALASPPDEAQAVGHRCRRGCGACAGSGAGRCVELQATPDRLDSEQITGLVAAGGAYGNGFTEPEPMNFEDHRGYISGRRAEA